MGRFFKRGKRIASRGLAGFLAALMVVTTVPTAAFESRAEEENLSYVEELLGAARSFGVVSQKFTQKQHMQTNFAVNWFSNSGVVNNDPDLITTGIDGNIVIPFYAADIDGTLRLDNFESNGTDRKQVIFYTPYSTEDNKNKNKISIKSPSNVTYYLIKEEKTDIEKKVNGMIGAAKEKSQQLVTDGKAEGASVVNINSETYLAMDQNKYEINVSAVEDTVVYVNVLEDGSKGTENFYNAMDKQGIDIIKRSDQVIVFNLLRDKVYLKQFDIRVTDKSNTLINSTGDMHLGEKNDFLRDEVMKKIIWNMPYATDVSIENSAGTYLVANLKSTPTDPKEANVYLRNTSTGWLVADGNFIQETGEWHFPYISTEGLPGGGEKGDVTLIAYKEYFQSNGTPAAAPAPQAKFGLFADAGCTGEPLMEEYAQPFNGKNVVFFAIELPASGQKATYYIKEIEVPSGYVELSEDCIVKCEVDEQGQVVYSKVQGSNVSIVNSYPVYQNTKENAATSGSIVLGKIVSSPSGVGVDWNNIKNDLEFKIYDTSVTPETLVATVTGSQLQDTNSNGTYDYTVSGLEFGKKYKIVETRRLPDGGTINSIKYTVSTDITSGDEKAVKDLGNAAGPALTLNELTADKPECVVTYTNTYKQVQERGDLIIRKVIDATNANNLWKEIQENDIQFVITRKSDNKVVKTLTKKDFTLESGSTYKTATITLDSGDYTIEEVKRGLNGDMIGSSQYTVVTNPTDCKYDVTISNSVTEISTFTNTYNEVDPGNIKITKSISGTGIAWEQVNKNIKFEITPDGSDTVVATIMGNDTNWKTDGSGNHYYLLEGLKPGNYTVKETSQGLGTDNKIGSDGYSVETRVDGTLSQVKTVSVTSGGTVSITYANAYTLADVGSITLNKIVETPSGITAPTVASMGDDLEFTITRIDGDKQFPYKGSKVTSATIKGGELSGGAVTLSGLPHGQYTITETRNGLDSTNKVGGNGQEYESVTVSVSTDGEKTYTVTNTQTITLGAGTTKVTFKNYYLPKLEGIKISKQKVGGEELSGATLKLYIDSVVSGNLVDEWESTGVAHEIAAGYVNPGTGKKFERGHKYILVETAAPGGYLIASEIEFTVEESGKIIAGAGSVTNVNADARIITMIDDAMSKNIELVKTYSDGASIDDTTAKSAEFTLYLDPACSTPIGDIQHPVWDAGTQKAIVTFDAVEYGLIAGNTYYVKETKRATGHAVSTKVFACKVAADGVTYSVVGGADANNKIVNGKPLCNNVAYSGSVKFQGKKNVSGNTSKGNAVEYQFVVKDEGGNEVANASRTGSGTFEFTEIKYSNSDVGKTYTYTISEKSSGKDYIIEKTEPYTVKVSVAAPASDDSSELVISVLTGESVYSFDNIYIDNLVISKKAMTGSAELSGAKMSLYKGKYLPGDELDEDTLIKSWTSGSKAETIPGELLKKETDYTLVEVAAPAGYGVATNIIFQIDKNGVLTYDAAAYPTNFDAGKRVITMFDKALGDISIDKKTITGSNRLSGATLRLYEGEYTEGVPADDIKPVLEWTSGTSAKTIPSSLLKTNATYTLVEVAAPKGYKVATNMIFEINAAGDVVNVKSYAKGIDTTNRYITMFDDALSDIKISKKDIDGTTELAGATLSLYEGRYAGEVPANAVKVVNDWASGASAATIQGSKLKAGQTYTLVEKAAPNGYAISTNIIFSIDKNGNVTAEEAYASSVDTTKRVIAMKDKAISNIEISKKAVSGEDELPGADLILYEGDSRVEGVKLTALPGESWKTSDTPHVILGSKLKVNTTYTLRETGAPDGYTKVTTDIIFRIEKEGGINQLSGFANDIAKLTTTGSGPVITMFDAAISDIYISKKAISGEEELGGASLELYEGDSSVEGDTLTLVPGESWKSSEEAGAHKIAGTKLKLGTTYTLRETGAPDGYKVTTDIIFKIDETGAIQKVSDFANGDLDTTGTIPVITMFDAAIGNVKISKKAVSGEDELSGATLKLYVGDESKGDTLAPVDGEEWLSGEVAHEIDGKKLKRNITYTLRETAAPQGYKIATDIIFAIDGNGDIVNVNSIATGEFTDAATKADGTGRTIVMFDGVLNDVKIIKTFTDASIAPALATSAKFGLYKDAACTDANLVQTANVQSTGAGTYEVVFTGKLLTAGSTYYLKEVKAPAGYLLSSDIIKCDVQDDGTVLYTKNSGTASTTFPECNNVKDTTVSRTGYIKLHGKKMLTGDSAPSEGYTFTVKEDGTVVDSLILAGAGTFDFTINYTKASDVGTHTYVISETAGSTLGMDYSGASYTVTVQVSEDAADTTKYQVTILSTDDGNSDGKKMLDGSEVYEFTNNYASPYKAPANIYISKKEIGGSDELKGAHMKLYKGEIKGTPKETDKLVDEWDTVSTGNHPIAGSELDKDQKYTLIETVAPAGYKVTTNIVFEIDVNDVIKPVGTYTNGEFAEATAAKRIITMFDDAISDISISKVDITTKKELENASLSLYEGKYTGPVTGVKPVDSWKSSASGAHVIKGTDLKLSTTYTLVEEGAPNGYKMATNIVFKIDENGAIQKVGDYPRGEFANAADAAGGKGRVIVMFDDAIGDISISKLDITGSKELTGAVLRLYEGSYTGAVTSATPVDSWKSTSSAHVIKGTALKLNTTYTLVEEGSPNGYKIATNMIFKIGANGEVINSESYARGIDPTNRYIALFDDAIENIFVSRKKVIGSKELPDATLKVYEGKHPGAVSGLTPIDSWKSSDTAHTIDGTKLKLDTEYTIVEEVAPAGSVIATNIVFKIDANGDIQPIGTYTLGEFTEATKTGRTITVLDASDGTPDTTPEVVPPAEPGTTTPVISVSTPEPPATNVELIIVHKTFDDGKKGTVDNEASGAKFTIFTDPSCKPETAVSGATDVEAVWMEQHQEWLVTFPTGIVPVGQTYYIKETVSPVGYLPDEIIYEVIVNTDGKVFYRIRGQETVTSAMSSRAMIALSSKIKAPKTGNYLDLEMPLAIILLLSAASVFCFAMRRRTEEE